MGRLGYVGRTARAVVRDPSLGVVVQPMVGIPLGAEPLDIADSGNAGGRAARVAE